MESPIKGPPSASLDTVASGQVLSVGPGTSLRKRKAVVLQPQPASSDSELSEEEPMVARRPPKKKRKVPTKTEVVQSKECFAVASGAMEPVKMTKRKRQAKAAMAEEEALGDAQENESPKKRTRKPRAVEPAVYNIPDVERKETTFRGMPHPRVTQILINRSFVSSQVDWDMYVSRSSISHRRY